MDAAAAEQDRATSGEGTHRFASALAAARSRLGETAAVETDLPQAEEYLLAHKGEAVVREVRGLLVELQAIRNGDEFFYTFADRATAEARVLARPHNLGHRIYL